MNDVENSVVLIARDASIVDAVAAVARTQSLPLRHFESAETWLTEADGMPLPSANHTPPAWLGCMICQSTLDGAELPPELLRVCELRQGLPVIVVSPQASVTGAVAAMQAGVSMVLEHPVVEAQLASALQAAVSRAQTDRPLLARATRAARRLAELNDGEQAVLDELLAGLANKEIAHKLEIGLRTVELRRSRITKKMNAHSLAELVRLVCEARAIAAV